MGKVPGKCEHLSGDSQHPFTKPGTVVGLESQHLEVETEGPLGLTGQPV